MTILGCCDLDHTHADLSGGPLPFALQCDHLGVKAIFDFQPPRRFSSFDDLAEQFGLTIDTLLNVLIVANGADDVASAISAWS
jgi:hypothetical protein